MCDIDWHETLKNDPRSIDELVACALTDADEDVAWGAVGVLHFRSTNEVLETAMALSKSPVARERQLGADLLGQFGCFEKQPYPCFDETVLRLIAMLPGEEDPGVLNSIGVGLGHRRAPCGVEPLCRLKSHSHEDVRFGVVMGLTGQADPLAIRTLIELTRDAETVIRDWATFTLGQQCNVDTPEVREALWLRTSDDDDMTRLEALSGLARRHDARIIPPLLEELRRSDVARVAIEAAGELGSPFLLEDLLNLRSVFESNAEYSDAVEQAISRCTT